MKNKIFIFSAAMLAAAPFVSVKADEYHRVQSGETLWKISQKYNVSVNNIKNLNNLKNDNIFVGQNLLIKKTKSSQTTTTTSVTHTVKKGETLWKIANQYKVSTNQIMSLNKMSNSTIYVGQKLIIKQTTNVNSSSNNSTVTTTTTTVNKTYVVKSGDTLWSISRNYKVNVNDIIKWNNLKSTTLYVGQKLNLQATSVTTNTNANSSTSVQTKLYAKVTASALNLRTSPDGSVVTVMPNGATVEVLSTSGSWYKVKYGNTTGWASKSYLNTYSVNVNGTTNTSTNTNTTTNRYAVVTASALNLRDKPNGNVIAIMPNSTKVQVIAVSGGWMNVKYGTKTGWASSQYLSEEITSGKVNTTGKVVLLDPGHGGADPGATNGNYYEKHLTMTYANKTKQYLENMGYTVRLTREGDKACLAVYSLTPDLQCRVNKAKELDADIFVSIHINSFVPGAIGTETFYNANSNYDGTMNSEPQKSKLLAESIHKRYQPAMGSTNRGVADSNLYVLRKNTVPSTLLEIGFISDYRDLNKMINTTYQNNISLAIAQGINDYFAKVK